VVSELLKGNKVSIRAITRKPSAPKAHSLSSKGVEVVKADMSDATSLRSALEGVERAYLVTDHAGPRGVAGEIEDGKRFVATAREAGVKHLVFSSVAAADQNSGVPHFGSKFEIEGAIKASGIPSWTILRPTTYMDNLSSEAGFKRAMGLGMFGSLLQGKSVQMIAVQDIGWFAARALEDPKGWDKKVITLAGDDLTVEQMKDVYAKVQGSRPWAAWIPAAVFGMMLPTDLMLMFKFFKDRGFDADISAARRMHPGLHTFEQYLLENQLPSPEVL